MSKITSMGVSSKGNPVMILGAVGTSECIIVNRAQAATLIAAMSGEMPELWANLHSLMAMQQELLAERAAKTAGKPAPKGKGKRKAKKTA